MSLFRFAVAAAAAASAGYFAARRNRIEPRTSERDPDDKKPSAKKPAASKASSPKKTPAKKSSPYDGLALALGDVVSVGGEERWLAGAVIARDEGKVALVLYMAPEGKEEHAVAVFAPPRKEIYVLAPAAVDCPSEPPTTLEIDGVALTRRSRLPVLLERAGQGAPDLPGEGIVAIYEAGGREIAVVIAANGRAYGWRGRMYDEGEYDRMGGGGVD